MHNLIPFLLFGIATMITPGPNNVMLLNSGLAFGVKQSLPLYFGICFGFALMVLIVALGLSNLFIRYHWLQPTLKIIGSLYMLYLAWRIASSTMQDNNINQANPINLLQAMLFQWVNPKAWIIAIGTISIFTFATEEWHNAMILSVSFLFISLPCLAAWLLLGAYLQTILKNKKHYQLFNIVLSITLVISIITMLI
ncbi:MAG: LysE family translocator [Gammaproteobacteria bacterium]